MTAEITVGAETLACFSEDGADERIAVEYAAGAAARWDVDADGRAEPARLAQHVHAGGRANPSRYPAHGRDRVYHALHSFTRGQGRSRRAGAGTNPEPGDGDLSARPRARRGFTRRRARRIGRAISMSGGSRLAAVPASSPTVACAIPRASSRPDCLRTIGAHPPRRARSCITRAISMCRSAAAAWRYIRAISSWAIATASSSFPPTSSMRSRKRPLATTLYEEFAEEEVARGRASAGPIPVAGDAAKRDFEAWKKARAGER